MMIRLEARYKYNNRYVVVKPVFFSWRIGIEYKALTGFESNSFFCNKADAFNFTAKSKVIIFFIKIWYWLKFWLYRKVRYQIPYKIKWMFKKVDDNDLPF